MIKELLARLQGEAAEEADHKAWCDGELATNKQTREAKTEEVNSLSASVDALKAEIAELGEQIAELNAAVAELDRAYEEATALRTKEKAKNEETIADAKEAQTAVSQALTILREFYKKASAATALVQGKARQTP